MEHVATLSTMDLSRLQISVARTCHPVLPFERLDPHLKRPKETP